jgi:transcription antitermination factor NusG
MIVFGILWFVVHTSAGKEATLKETTENSNKKFKQHYPA